MPTDRTPGEDIAFALLLPKIYNLIMKKHRQTETEMLETVTGLYSSQMSRSLKGKLRLRT